MAKTGAGSRARSKRRARRVLIPVAAVLVLLVAAADVHAFVNLPASGSRVDNDAASGISPAQGRGRGRRGQRLAAGRRRRGAVDDLREADER